MKIIRVDNFSRDSVSDLLVAVDVHKYYGSVIVELLNKRAGENGSHYFKVVPDDYVLYEYDPT